MPDSSKPLVRSDTTDADRRAPLPLDSQARRIARVSLTITLLGLAIWLAADFIPALAWAAILAIAIWPLYSRCAASPGQSRSPILAPLVFTTTTGVILSLPLVLAAHQISQQGAAIFSWITQARERGIAVPEWVAELPLAAETVQRWWSKNLADPAAASDLFKSINIDRAAEWTGALGSQLLHRSFLFLVCLVALFVFLRHGAWIAGRLLDTADQVLGDPGERLASKMADAVRGTVNGTAVVAVAEGLLIGLAYLLAGVPNPTLFTFLTVAFAMVPFGAWAAFAAAAIALFASGGSAWMSLGVLGWGAAVMLAGDHFVWPALVGNAARLPFLLALIGVFGGLQTFGLVGLFLGPVIMASILTIWREWLVSPAARDIQTSR